MKVALCDAGLEGFGKVAMMMSGKEYMSVLLRFVTISRVGLEPSFIE